MVYNRKPKSGLKKRWSIGAGIKLPGGYGGNVRFNSRSLKKEIKSVVRQTEETKVFVTGDYQSSTLKHNTLYTFSATQGITQGLTSSNRIGNTIFLRHIKMKGVLSTGSNNSMSYRIMALWGETQGAAAWNAASVLGVTEIFQTSTFYTFALTNPKANTSVILDKVITINNAINASETHKLLELDIPVMKTLNYDKTTAYFRDKQLYILVIPFVSGGVTGTTSVGAINWNATATFKDA